MTGDQQYYYNAIDSLNWWLSWAFEVETGRVWDTITSPGCLSTRVGLQAWTYNSGVILHGLADLYYATGNTTLLDLGRSIAYAAMRDFSMPDIGVLQESCEHDGPASAGAAPGCPADLIVVRAFSPILLCRLNRPS